MAPENHDYEGVDRFLDDDPELPTEEARPWSHTTLQKAFPDQRRDLKCPRCKGDLLLKDGRFGFFYGCENWINLQCTGSMDCNQQTVEPFLLYTDEFTLEAQRRLQVAFDQVWTSGLKSKPQAFLWLAEFLNRPARELRFQYLSKEECARAMKAIRKLSSTHICYALLGTD
jgi:hypothetical protein